MTPGAVPGFTPDIALPSAGMELPRRIGRYTLVRRLAEGGMAEIFLAVQDSLAGFKKLVVIKRILPQHARDDSFAERLLDEARLAATLSHPHIAEVYDVGSYRGQYFLAMEYVHGQDLRSIVRKMQARGLSAMPLHHCVGIATECASALAYAHERLDIDGRPLHLVHRDVSPHNILISFRGDTKLIDFGVAKVGLPSSNSARSPRRAGKIPYMSPEQARGDEVDERSDLFSLGIILYELSTGERLFLAPTEAESVRRILAGRYPKAHHVNPRLPSALGAVIDRALQPNPEARYQTARELQVDLEMLARDERLPVSSLSLGHWMESLFTNQIEDESQLIRIGSRTTEDSNPRRETTASERSCSTAEVSSARSQSNTSYRRRRRWGRLLALSSTALVVVTLLGLGLSQVTMARPTPVGPKVRKVTQVEGMTPQPLESPSSDLAPTP